MSMCVIGRGITHADSENFPGCQHPCPHEGDEILVVDFAAKGGGIEEFDICTEHMNQMIEKGLVGARGQADR